MSKVNKRLGSAFKALLEDFEKHGADAIRIVRVEDPARYLAVIAQVCPRELQVESGLAELDDSELDSIIAQLRQRVLTERRDGALEAPSMEMLPFKEIANG